MFEFMEKMLLNLIDVRKPFYNEKINIDYYDAVDMHWHRYQNLMHDIHRAWERGELTDWEIMKIDEFEYHIQNATYDELVALRDGGEIYQILK